MSENKSSKKTFSSKISSKTYVLYTVGELRGDNMPSGEEKEGEPIYEKLAPNEILLISKEGNYIIYAVNRNGKLEIKRTRLPEEEK